MTNEKKNFMDKEFTFCPGKAIRNIKRLIGIILTAIVLVTIVSPKTITRKIAEYENNKRAEAVVETKTKEYQKIFKAENVYTILYDDCSYYSAPTLEEVAVELTNATGRAFACANGNLYETSGGKLEVVTVSVYR